MPNPFKHKDFQSSPLPNPGPIIAYPSNQSLFPTRASADKIRPGQRIAIPWHPDVLRKIIATSEALILDVSTTAKRLIEHQIHDKEELEDYLRKIDAINMIAQIHVSVGAIVAEGLEQGGSLTSRQIVNWLADSRAHMFAGDLAPLVIPCPSAPKKDFTFYIRHALGPWTPSFWSSVYTAIKERDLDLYLYGSDAVTYRTILKIKTQADQDIAKLNANIGRARHQLAMSFYKSTI